MTIAKKILPDKKRKPLFSDAAQLKFGRTFTDHMFTMAFAPGPGWHDAEIRPYQPLALDPAACVLHYSQEVFEGQKAYRSPRGETLLFRPQENARRLNQSLLRMCMPEFPEEMYLKAECELLQLEKRWIPALRGTALYVRPAVIGTEAALGIHSSSTYLFFIILSPVGFYFPEGFNPISLWVSDKLARVADGGTGAAKTGGNYAASLLAAKTAHDKGYSQVLWLDGREHRFIEEVGGMNIFFLLDSKLITPPLNGNILAGITRKSVLQLAADMGLECQERQLTIDEVLQGISSGRINEAFATGTAAVITPVGKISYLDKEYVINDKIGKWTQKLYDTLTGIQYGELSDPHGWIYRVN